MSARAPTSADSRRLSEEQAALRRVATLVARGAAPGDVFSACAAEVGRVLGVATVTLDRYDANASIVLASWNWSGFHVGTRWPLDGPSLAATVHATGRPARIEDYSALEGPIADAVRTGPSKSTVGVPIVVGGSVWGVMCAGSSGPEPLPPDTEERLAAFTELVATAIANSEARDRLHRIVAEQAALRQVALLVAEGASPSELFAAVAEGIATVFGLGTVTLDRYDAGFTTTLAQCRAPMFPVGTRWPLDGESLSATVLATGRPARLDDYTGLEGTIAKAIREVGTRSTVGVPIVVEGRVWGIVAVGTSGPEPLPADTEERLAGFTELLGTAIANAEARENLRRLADEQAALRRVATLVAEGAEAEALFSTVAEEIAHVLDVPTVTIGRYEGDASIVIASLNAPGFPVGSVWRNDEPSVGKLAFETGRPARIDDYSDLEGTVAAANRAHGIRSTVGVPILVEGRLWGVTCIATRERSLPADAEDRLARFTELVATAIANREARDNLRRLVEEQAALRRVATRVAEAPAPEELFAAVTNEASRLLGLRSLTMFRFEPDGTATVIASATGDPMPVGAIVHVHQSRLVSMILATGRPAGVDATTAGAYAFGAPIVVDRTVWGAMVALVPSGREPGADAEARLSDFTALVATAVSNAAARDGVRALAEEQAALHRVAALVARGTDAPAVFDAVCEETGRLAGAARVSLSRFTSDGSSVTVAEWRRSLGDLHAPAETASSVSAHVVVDGRVWGELVAASDAQDPLPPGTDRRLARFTRLIATAISNAAAHSQLIASRARLLAAGDEARRRIERTLHDGTQRQLRLLRVELDRVRETIPEELREERARVARVEDEIETVLDEVRELSRGLHPAQLSRGGLRAALRALAQTSPIAVDLSVETDERPPEPVETGAYYVVSEALTNAAKYSHATAIAVSVATRGSTLYATIEDDGIGGAEAGPGSGLTGLRDRVEALGGRFSLDSPAGVGTRIAIELPL